jgi:hypothetical protein
MSTNSSKSKLEPVSPPLDKEGVVGLMNFDKGCRNNYAKVV